MLHLVGCLHYLYQWCMVKQISDNEIYLLIKYIKSVLWRVAKRLSYIQDARCLKVNKMEQMITDDTLDGKMWYAGNKDYNAPFVFSCVMFLLAVYKTHTECNRTLSQAARTCKLHWRYRTLSQAARTCKLHWRFS